MILSQLHVAASCQLVHHENCAAFIVVLMQCCCRATAQHNLAHQGSPRKESPKEPEFVYRKQYLAAQSASCSEGACCPAC